MQMYKKWLIQLFWISIIFFTPIVGSVIYHNYLVDPLWNFDHQNEFNTIQIGFDERQQKTNYILNRKFTPRSLMIGSSRVTYMNETEFQKDDVYNYALSDIHIDEYSPYIQFAEEVKKEPFDKIYMELYFGSFNIRNFPFKSPDEYFGISKDPLYRFTSLFSYDTYKRAEENKKLSLANYYKGYRSYSRDNVVTTSFVNERIDEQFANFPDTFQRGKETGEYPYNELYKEKLLKLKNDHPQTKFVVFTDPMPTVRLKTMLQDELYWEQFVRWYHEMVDVFGEVYSFQLNNKYTSDNSYWFDAFHFYPSFGNVMVEQLEKDYPDPTICYVVTKENINDYFKLVRRCLSLPTHPFSS